MSIVYYNGQFLPEEAARIPCTDRGFLFGEGVFTTVRVQKGRAEWLTRHFERLKDHSRQLGIESPILDEKMVAQLIRENRAVDGIWRLKIVVTQRSLLMLIKPYTPPQ